MNTTNNLRPHASSKSTRRIDHIGLAVREQLERSSRKMSAKRMTLSLRWCRWSDRRWQRSTRHFYSPGARGNKGDKGMIIIIKEGAFEPRPRGRESNKAFFFFFSQAQKQAFFEQIFEKGNDRRRFFFVVVVLWFVCSPTTTTTTRFQDCGNNNCTRDDTTCPKDDALDSCEWVLNSRHRKHIPMQPLVQVCRHSNKTCMHSLGCHREWKHNQCYQDNWVLLVLTRGLTHRWIIQ